MRAPFLAVAVLGLACSCLAQESRAVIIGRVTDSSGAVVAGAQVRAINIETNAGGSSVSNPEGNYEIPYLLPGLYTVTVEMTGFNKSVREKIELRVQDRLTLDFTLQVGSVAETITVAGETPLLESSTVSLGMIMDERRVQELPVVGGNAFYLSRLSPGVVANGGRSAGNPMDFGAASGNIVVNGTRTGSSDVLLDGASNMFNTNAAYAPPADLVQEFKIQTATFDASLGAAGAVVNVSMQAGANTLHGTAYHFDSRIRAVPWFVNKELYDPRSGPPTGEKRERLVPRWLHQHWGTTLRGPVVLPGYNGRNKTFWSFGYEGLYIRRNLSFTATVPTLEERKGDFSALLRISPQYQIYDPRTIAVAPQAGRFSRLRLQGNIVPPSLVSPIARNIVGYWPEPNAAGTADGRQNYFRIQSIDRDNRSMVGRLDHNFSEKHRVFFRLNNNQHDNKTQTMPTVAVGNVLDHTGWGGVLDNVYVFNPRLLLNVHYSLTYQNPRNVRQSQGFDLLSLGFPQSLINEIHTKAEPSGIAFPEVVVDGSAYTNLGASGGDNRAITYQTVGGTLTRLAGNHSFRFGSEFRWLRENAFNFGNVAPRLEFAQAWTRGPLDNSTTAPIGQGLASMMMGYPTGGRINVNASQAEQSTSTSFYIQDDWKLTRRVTVNLGLRYDYNGPTTERYDRALRGYDFDTPNPIEAQARANYARAPIQEVPVSSFRTIGGLTFLGVGGEPRGLWAGDRNNFAPRIGVAWQLTPKTVVRSGYGIFYEGLGVNREDVNQGGFNQPTNIIPSLDNGLSFAATLSNPFPNGLDVPTGAAGGLRTFLGRGISYFHEQLLNGYMQRWSFTVSRELPQRVVLETSYVGNRGTHLLAQREMNAVPRPYLSTSPVRDQGTIDFLSFQTPSPFFGLPDFAGTGLGNQRTSRGNLLRPYPHFGGITVDLPIGYSYYHSLQVHAEKRMAKGFTFQASWTWSKFMQATQFLNDTDARPDKVISDQDFPHRLAISAIWELPVGSGKPLLGGAKGLLGHVVGGWSVLGWYEGQSGQTLGGVNGLGNLLFYGNIKDIPLPVSERSVERWFNTGAGFETDTRKRLDSNIRTFPSRFNNFRGDGINNLDLSLFKNFRITERLKAQFRMETYNTLNHVQFDAPGVDPYSTAFGTITEEKGHGQRQLTFAVKLLF